MDALSPHRALGRALFAQGKWQAGLAALAIAGAIWSAMTHDPGLRLTHEMLSAFALVSTLGMAAQRMAALATCAGPLGIPWHRRRLRQAQWLVLASALGFAITLELQFALDLRAVVIPVLAASVIVSITSLPGFSVAVILAVAIANSVSQQLLPLLLEPAGASLTLGVCAAALARWFVHTWQLHEQAAVASHRLADSAHEAADAATLDEIHVADVSQLAPALEADGGGRLSARRFWIGMGFDPASSWKAVGYALLAATVLLTVCHFVFAGRHDHAAYLIPSCIAGYFVFGRMHSMHERWLRTPHEQSVLLLSPRWPQGSALKIAFMRSLWSGWPGYAVFWAGLSAFVLAAGWVDSLTVQLTGAGLLVLGSMVLVLMMHYLSQRRARQTSPYALVYVVLQIVGAVTLGIGWAAGSAAAALIGLATLLLPALPAIYLFATRRPQFPVQPPPGPQGRPPA